MSRVQHLWCDCTRRARCPAVQDRHISHWNCPSQCTKCRTERPRTIFFPILLSCHILLGTPLSKTPKELTVPNNSATSVETIYEQGNGKLAAISHPKPRRYNILLGYITCNIVVDYQHIEGACCLHQQNVKWCGIKWSWSILFTVLA